MKQQHTPGPWIFDGREVVDRNDNTIALVNALNQWDTTEGIAEEKMPWEANARLIAAAPDLLYALRELYEAGLTMNRIPYYKALRIAKELIEKIEYFDGDNAKEK